MEPNDRDRPLPAHRPSVWPRPADQSLTYVLPSSKAEEGESDVSRLAALVRRQRWTILAVALLTLLAVAVFTWLTPKVYQSNATVLIEPSRGGNTETALDVLGRVGRSNTMETEMELVTSRRVMEPVVEELGLHALAQTGDESRPARELLPRLQVTREAPGGGYRVVAVPRGGYVIRSLHSGAVLGQADQDVDTVAMQGVVLGGLPVQHRNEYVVQVIPFEAAVNGVRGQISASPVRREANLIQITCRSERPKQAQRLCQSVSSSYMELRSDLRRTEATAAAAFLSGQVEQVGARLAEAENQLGQYQRNNQAVALDERASAEVVQYAQMRAHREQVEAERSTLNRVIRSTGEYRDLASSPTFLRSQSPLVGDLLSSLVQLENRRSELAVTRTERNPDLAAIDERIRDIEGQLGSFARNYENALGQEVRSLDVALGRTGGQLTAIPMKQVETARLQRQVTLLADLYTYLQTRLREAEVAEAVNLPSVRIVDRPSMPFGPSQPKVMLNLGLGAILGLGFGIMIAFYRDHADSRLRERKEVERETGIPVLGMIPGVKRPGPVVPLLSIDGNGQGKLPAAHAEVGNGVKRSWEEEIVLEAFRSLASDLKFTGARMGNGRLRSVAVTSSGRGDGKTFTACNLAIARASQGDRTLLIDADLRASGVARFFGLPWTTPGLTDVLSGHLEAGAVQKEVGISEGVGLRVIVSGDPNNRSSGMLERHSLQVSAVIESSESDFDLVVVDTPPLNVLTDAATIAAHVDAVIVVVRGGVTDRSALELTLDRLGRASARVVGIVLNDVDLPEYYTSYSHDFSGEATS